MKHVTFIKDVIGSNRAGEMRLVPDDLALKLETEGLIAPNAPSWPPQGQQAQGQQADAKQMEPARRPRGRLRRAGELLGQTYLTK